MKCKRCKRTTKKLKRPNPVVKSKPKECYYCEECKIIYTVLPKTDGEKIILARPIQEGDRIEGDMFTPYYS